VEAMIFVFNYDIFILSCSQFLILSDGGFNHGRETKANLGLYNETVLKTSDLVKGREVQKYLMCCGCG